MDTKEQIKVFSGVCLEDKNHFIIKSTKVMHLLVVLTLLYAPFSRSFANNNRNSDTKELRFLFLCGIMYAMLLQKTEEL